jgi:hypothetical protein
MATVGNRFYSDVEFRHPITRVETDPTDVFFKVRAPDGTETTYEFGVDANVTKTAVGLYRAFFDVASGDDPGNYWARWVGEGALVASCEDPVEVEESEFDSP